MDSKMSMIDGGDAFSDFHEPPNVGTYSDATRTVQDVMKEVKRVFGDESGVQLEDADILMFVNNAQLEIVRRNKILKATSTTSSVVGQKDYAFPSSDILQIESLHYAGSRLPNMSFAQAEESLISDPTVPDNGEPIVWYEWGGRFSFYPVPSTVKPVTLYYTRQPARITTVTDKLGVSDKYYNDVVRFVLKQAYEMDEDWAASEAKGQQFDASLSDQAEEERTAANMTYPVITVYYD